MSCFGDQTSSTTIPGAGDQEKSLFDILLNTVLPAYMDQAGYEVTPTRVTDFGESDAGKKLQADVDAAQAAYDNLAAKMPNNPSPSQQSNLNNLANQLQSAQGKYNDAAGKFEPYTDYTSRKKDSPAAEALRQQYGENSQEYKDQIAKDQATLVSDSALKTEINSAYLTKVKDFVEGKISVSPEQEKFIQDQFAPIKSVIDSIYEGDKEKGIAGVFDQIKKTSMDTIDALNTVGKTIQETGKNMDTALSHVVETNKQLLEMGIKDKTGEITRQVAQQAIATGRDPADPAYAQETQTEVAKQIKTGQLNLASMEAQGKLQITERTGAGLENIQREIAGVKQQEGNQTLGAIQQRGETLTRLEEAKANTRQGFAVGLPPQQISTGGGFSSLNQALATQRLMNASAPGSFISGATGYYTNQRMAQPTTTTSRGFGALDALGIGLGIAGAGTDIYSGYQQAGASNRIADAYAGYGGGGYGGGGMMLPPFVG